MHAVEPVAAPARARPQVPVDVRADAVGAALLAAQLHLREEPAAGQPAAVDDVVHLDDPRRRDSSVDDVELPVVGREAESVRLLQLVGDEVHPPSLGIDPVDRLLHLQVSLVPLVVHHAAVAGVGEPDPPVGMDHDVVGGIERLAVPALGEHGHRPRVLVADHAPVGVLARDLPPLEVERVAVDVAGRVAEDAHVAVLVETPEQDVVGDVAPYQVTPAGAPGRTLRPGHAGVQALDGGVAELVLLEARVERDHVGIRIADRADPRPVALVGPRGPGKHGARGRREGGGEERAAVRHGRSLSWQGRPLRWRSGRGTW